MKYYKIPLNFDQIGQHSPFSTCDLGESISQNLFSLICTRKGEVPSDPEYGSNIWDLEFQRIVNKVNWEDAVYSSLYELIEKYEPRIYQVSMDVNVAEVEVKYPFREYPEVKSQAQITITAKVKHTNENFRFSTELFISPMAK